MPGDDPRGAGIFEVSASGCWREVIVGRFAPSAAIVPLVLPSDALAQDLTKSANLPVGALEVIQFAMFAGVMIAALVSAVWLIRERARTAAQNEELRGRVSDLSAALQRSDALLNLKDQRLIVWTSEKRKPDLIGSLAVAGAPEERSAFLAFGRWLTPRSAAALEHAVSALREKGTAFDLVAETQAGTELEVQGRLSSVLAVVRVLS